MITLTENAAGKVKELWPRKAATTSPCASPCSLVDARVCATHVPGRPGQREGPGRGAVRRPARDRQDERALPLAGQDRLRRHPGAVRVHDRQPGGPGWLRLRQLASTDPAGHGLTERSLPRATRPARAERLGDLGDVCVVDHERWRHGERPADQRTDQHPRLTARGSPPSRAVRRPRRPGLGGG